jgi:hypothetical protein
VVGVMILPPPDFSCSNVWPFALRNATAPVFNRTVTMIFDVEISIVSLFSFIEKGTGFQFALSTIKLGRFEKDFVGDARTCTISSVQN